MRKILLSVLLAVTIIRVFGQELVTNVNEPINGQEDLGSLGDTISEIHLGQNYIELKGKLYFLANTSDFGREIWVYDPISDETNMLKDITPNSQSTLFTEQQLEEWGVIFNNEIYFYARQISPEGKFGLWKTDGTEEGTVFLESFQNVNNLMKLDNKLYFFAELNETERSALWSIADENSEPSKVLELNSRSRFGLLKVFGFKKRLFIQDRENRDKLTLVNIEEKSVKEVFDTLNSFFRIFKTKDEQNLYLFNEARDGSNILGTAIYALNIENEEFVEVASFDKSNTFIPKHIKEKNGFLYIELEGGNNVYRYDINNKEVVLLEEFDSGFKRSINEKFNDPFYVFSTNETTSIYTVNDLNELEKNVDVVVPENAEAANIVQINESDYYVNFSTLNDDLGNVSYIVNILDNTVIELPLLKENAYVVPFVGNLYFSKDGEPWVSEGSNESTKQLANIETRKKGSFCFQNEIGRLGDIVFQLGENNRFNTTEIVTFNEGLFVFEELFKEEFSFSFHRYPRQTAEFGLRTSFKQGVTYKGKFYFYIEGIFEVSSSDIIYSTDGTKGGTVLFEDYKEGERETDEFLEFFKYKDKFYFLLRGKEFSENEKEIYFKVFDGNSFEKIDLSDQLSEVVGEFRNSVFNTYVKDDLIILNYTNNTSVFPNKQLNGSGVFVIDGITNDLKSFKKDLFINRPVLSDDEFMFFSPSEVNKEKLSRWVINKEGTLLEQKKLDEVLSYSLFSSIVDNNLGYPLKSGKTVLFNFLNDNSSVISINEDGNENLVKEFESIKKEQPLLTDNIVFFSANDGGETGTELWKTDGTPEGTILVKDIFEGNQSSAPIFLLADVENRGYFSAYTNETGHELWRTDGTEEGTQMLFDLYPGPISSNPSAAIEIGEEIFFCASSSNELGQQIWKFNKNDETLSIVDVTMQEVSNVFYPNPVNDYLYTSNSSIDKISVYNMKGVKVLDSDLDGARFNVSNLNVGIYLVSFKLDGETKVVRLLKK